MVACVCGEQLRALKDRERAEVKTIEDAAGELRGKKVLEESAEAWMAAEHESGERAAEEISQLLYHVQVLMLARGLTLDDVYEHL